MQRFRSTVALLALSVPMVVGVGILGTGTAFATACPSPTTIVDQGGYAWPMSGSTNALGIRAAVLSRITGSICTAPSGGHVSFSADVVGLRSPSNSVFVEGGVAHYNTNGGASEYCIWSNTANDGIGSGLNVSNCGLANNTTYLIKTQKFQETSGQQDVTSWYCGTTDWSSCGSTPIAVDLWSSFSGLVKGYASAVTNYGGAACTNDWLGAQGNPAVIGGTGNAIVFQTVEGGGWGNETISRNWSPTCSSDYIDNSPSSGTSGEYDAHDSRN